MNFDVAVIGGGPSGLAAALKAWEEGAQVVLLERETSLGGVLMQCIHNGFGLHYFSKELTGPEYATRFVKELLNTNVVTMTNTMVLGLSQDKLLTCVNETNGYFTIRAKAVVLAMGCRERSKGALNIAGTRPSGIFSAGCAQKLVNIDGYMVGKDVVILGSGDIGLIMARRLTWEGAKVHMVCEVMPYSSGLNRNIVQCLKDNDIPLLLNTTVVKIHGQERLFGVTIAQVDERRKPIKETFRYIPCDTLLLSVGLIPENELSLDAGVEIDPMTNGAVVDNFNQTSVEGIFACGNVLHVHDLVDNVTLESMTAGKFAAQYAKEGVLPEGNAVRTVAGKNVRYVVPQKVHLTNEKQTLFFRVSDVLKNPKITVLSGGEVVASKKKRIVTPGEMEEIAVDLRKCRGDITVEAEVL